VRRWSQAAEACSLRPCSRKKPGLLLRGFPSRSPSETGGCLRGKGRRGPVCLAWIQVIHTRRLGKKQPTGRLQDKGGIESPCLPPPPRPSHVHLSRWRANLAWKVSFCFWIQWVWYHPSKMGQTRCFEVVRVKRKSGFGWRHCPGRVPCPRTVPIPKVFWTPARGTCGGPGDGMFVAIEE
jgi:hypothetical protein